MDHNILPGIGNSKSPFRLVHIQALYDQNICSKSINRDIQKYLYYAALCNADKPLYGLNPGNIKQTSKQLKEELIKLI